MGVTEEAVQGRGQGIRSSAIRKAISLKSNGLRIAVEPDSSVRSFDSLEEGRSLFGWDHLWIYKVKSGIVIPSGRTDWSLRPAPRSVQFSGKVFDSIEVSQSIDFYQGTSAGYLRRVSMKNSGTAPATIRLIAMLDPTAAQLGVEADTRGSLGINAFNRGSHIAMDEISDPPSARVIGSVPEPRKFFMTADKTRALDLLQSGELPDSTAGMSGQVVIMSLHELELSPSEAKEVMFAALYNKSRLEEALAAFGRLQSGLKTPAPRVPGFACSSQAVTDAAGWAISALDGLGFVSDHLDRYEALKAAALVDPEGTKSILQSAKSKLRRDGSVPHSLDQTTPGVLESALFLEGESAFLLRSGDKKLARSLYPQLRKVSSYLLGASKEATVLTDPALPQGWRRLTGRGYPTGEIPEVSLATAAGLSSAAKVARMLSKSGDSGSFRERSDMIVDRVRKHLLDERGFLCHSLDSSGRLRIDETIDMAVAAARHPFMESAEQAAAHRLLERDFETPYGPRTVPQSNKLYFNPSYGQGQLGGFWTRAALAHALLCYRVGLAGIGSLAIERVAKLVMEDSVKLGSSPGDFPTWVNVEAKEAHGKDSDVVAASRFIECLAEGELGMKLEDGQTTFSPALTSSLKWALAAEIWTEGKTTVFAGRGGGKVHAFAGGSRVSVEKGAGYSNAEQLDPPARGLHAVSLFGPGQLICVGSSSALPVRGALRFTPRAPELAKRLSTPLEEYDRTKSSWVKVASLRVFPTMTFDVAVQPGDWKAFRVSTA
ncbi:MAG: hypothetical protein ACHQYR_00970 [Candidatus Gagatemarchaeaceae archaeon]